MVHYAVHVQDSGEFGDPRVLAAMAEDAERAGWDGFFIWDHIVHALGRTAPVVDPVVALAAIAARTERIRFGPMVTPLARRRPWKVARETVSLDVLSQGRLVLGVGLGEPADEEFAGFGEEADPKARAARLDESLDILSGLWTGEPFGYRGAHYRVEETTFLPPPVQSPRIPVWVAGEWPNRAPFRRAARWDGVFPSKRGVAMDEMMTPADLRAIVSYIRQERTSDARFDVALGGYTPASDRQHAVAIVEPYVEVAGLTWWLEGLNSLRGSLDDARERIRQGPPKP
jgi:alkanesulfonate monooxygenase SsuD/methylene tetrahydromethanopterin reductase-like flavin-dependent oxidoreductase (luciferase family)